MGRKTGEKIKNLCIFALPGCLIFCAVVILPFLYGFYLTLTDWDGVSKVKNIIGVQNYISVFKDTAFWSSMGLTLKYVLLSVILVNAVAFLLAYALTNGIKGQKFFRAGFFTPNLIGGVVLGFIWQFVFSRVLVNMGKSTGWGLFSTSWLADPNKAFWSMVIVTVWQLSGYMMLIYIAGFTGLSTDVLEAASIDGATGLQKMKSIILPLMVPSFVICLFLTLSRAFMVYDVNLTLTGGEPYGSTRLVAMHVYEKAFTSRNYGVGQAEAEGGRGIMSRNSKVGGTKRRVLDVVGFTAIIVLFLLYMVPFILVLLNSFKQKRDIIKNPFSLITEKGYTLANYTKAFEKMEFIKAFGNSLFITGLSTLLVIIFASMVAYYFTRAKNTFSRVFFALMAASMIIPFQAIMIPLVSIYGSGLHLLNHRLTLIFMHTGFALSMSVFIYQGFIKSGIPISLEEAAYLDGCTNVQTFFKVVFPLLKPTTATLVILNVLAFWNDYLLPSLVLGKKNLYTLPLSTYSFYGTYSSDYGVIMAALVLTVAPILVLYLFLQKEIIDGVVAGAVKS